jgi:hypothetical protein
MTDTARRLRAQKAYSTDLGYLERMAREEESRRVDPNNDVAAEVGDRGESAIPQTAWDALADPLKARQKEIDKVLAKIQQGMSDGMDFDGDVDRGNIDRQLPSRVRDGTTLPSRAESHGDGKLAHAQVS